MKFVLDHPNKLAEISNPGRNGVWLLKDNLEIEVRGNLEITNPIKVSGTTLITGELGSSLTFSDKGSITCSSSARRLSISGLTLCSDQQKPIISVPKNTARTLTLHRVTVNAQAIGEISASSLVMSQCSFLNENMKSIPLGSYLETLVLSGVRHDGRNCLLDGCTTTFGGTVSISDAFLKDQNSGLLLINDRTTDERDKRCMISPATFILSNIQGVSRELDIFRQLDHRGILQFVDYRQTKPYVI